jgi:two-component system, cell cycle response regulator
MSSLQVFSVATLGFEDRERRVLRNVLAISEHRAPAFKPFVPAKGTHPHIVIINADRAESIQGWHKYHLQTKLIARIVPIFLSRAPLAESPRYALSRPILATRLFALLEQAVTETFGFTAALALDVDDPLVIFGAPDAPIGSAGAPPVGSPRTPATATASAATAPAVAAAPNAAATRAAAAPSTTAAPTAPTATGRSARHEVTALVVDDSLPVRIQMQSALKSIAAHVDFAETGEQALELIDKRAYSIIFLDVILPGKDGYDICRRVKKHPQQQQAAVVMLTSNSSPADRVKGKLAGCDTYLIKPVRQAVFEQVVAEFVRAPAAA